MTVKNDDLGQRMKISYEQRTQTSLLRRMYTVIRVDGKCFSQYTRGLDKPFDRAFMSDMDSTAIYLCENIAGAKCGYVQSDEISILMTDFDTLSTQGWFDYKVQKMVSVSASLATAKFNQLRMFRNVEATWEEPLTAIESTKLAQFDSRVFQLPDRSETINYFRWRQKDAVRNSISSVAQSLYSHKELFGMNTDQMQEMCFQKGINWNDFTFGEKRGRGIYKEYFEKEGTTRSKWAIEDFSEEWIPEKQ